MIANARMYSISPRAKAAWRDVLAWVLRQAAAPWEIIDHDAPAPLAALWAREDLGCALMCGLPFALRTRAPLLIAAPVPAPPRYGGLPRYMTDLAVRADSPYRRIEDTFGGNIGYTVADSQSGYFALRQFLRPFQRQRGGALYRSVEGGLLNARGVIDALAAGRIDVGPLDSYCYDLLRHLEPGCASQVRIIGTTLPAPIPPFVATAHLEADLHDRLRRAFAAVESAGELGAARADLLLSRFAFPPAEDYAPLRARHAAVIAAPEVW